MKKIIITIATTLLIIGAGFGVYNSDAFINKQVQNIYTYNEPCKFTTQMKYEKGFIKIVIYGYNTNKTQFEDYNFLFKDSDWLIRMDILDKENFPIKKLFIKYSDISYNDNVLVTKLKVPVTKSEARKIKNTSINYRKIFLKE